jgi:hypothetical protein
MLVQVQSARESTASCSQARRGRASIGA